LILKPSTAETGAKWAREGCFVFFFLCYFFLFFLVSYIQLLAPNLTDRTLLPGATGPSGSRFRATAAME
jgi:hypothetical protein